MTANTPIPQATAGLITLYETFCTIRRTPVISEAETADLYIEKTAHVLARKYRVTVATSDAVEQIIIFGSGAYRMSARMLLEEIIVTEREMRERYAIGSDD